jgi:hypothetical protein
MTGFVRVGIPEPPILREFMLELEESEMPEA